MNKSTRQHDEQSDLVATLLRHQEEAGRCLALRLHDTASQTLAAAAMHLSVVERFIEQLPDRARIALSHAAELIEESSREVRAISREVYPSLIQDAGSAAALQWLVEQSRAHLQIDLHVGSLERLHQPVEIALYRTVEDSIACVRRMGLTAATVRVSMRAGQLRLTVEARGGSDAPMLYDPTLLMLMEARLRCVGGGLRVQQRPPELKIEADLPCIATTSE